MEGWGGGKGVLLGELFLALGGGALDARGCWVQRGRNKGERGVFVLADQRQLDSGPLSSTNGVASRLTCEEERGGGGASSRSFF